MPRRFDRSLPAGACDSHNHVFGPFEKYPLSFPPDHPMPFAPVETYLDMLDRSGLQRGVLVQPTQHACEMDAMLDALKISAGRLRGIGAASSDSPDADLDRMHQYGIAGLRFVEAPLPSGAPRPGAVGFDEISQMSSRMRERNWTVNVWARMPTLMDNLHKLLDPGLPLVFEHMGMLDVEQGVQGRDFQTLLALLREGRAWVKLSVCRCSAEAPAYDDVRPFTESLVDANPDRLLWGSDWPFIRMQGSEPDVSSLLELLLDWVDDADIQRKILVENPAVLFGFEPSKPLRDNE